MSDLYFLQPDGSYAKGDGRSAGMKREDIPAGAEINEDTAARKRKSGRIKPGSVKIEDAEPGDTVEITAGINKGMRIIFERFAENDTAWVVNHDESFKVPLKDLIITDLASADIAGVNDRHLYHITGAHKALSIIAKQELKLPLAETNNSETSVGAHKLFYMSFARTLTSGYIGDRGEGNTMGDPVLLIFDRSKLENLPRTKIKPVDYWQNTGPNGRQMFRAKEAEERLFSDKPILNVKGMILEVRLMVAKDDYRDRRLKEVMTLCKRLKIPCKLFDIKDIQGFLRGRENKVERQELFDWLKSQKAPEVWSSSSDALKASIVRKKLPNAGYHMTSMQRLNEFVHKKKVSDLSKRAREEISSILRYDRGLNPFKDYYVANAELHNMRAGREEDRDRFHKMLVAAKVKNIDQFFKKLSDKWRAAYDEHNREYNDAMDRKYKTGKYAEAAALDVAAAGFQGDPQRKGTLAGIKYDQTNGLGNVPSGANINYAGLAVIMTAKTFLRCVPPRGEAPLDAEAIKFIEEKGIGSPFLLVDFEQNPPKVKSHEGRGRAMAISELHEPNTPMLVHIFPFGGDRARHLTPEKLKALYNSLGAEKSSDKVPSPITPIVWHLGEWKSIPGLEGSKDAASFIDEAQIKPKTDYQVYIYTGSRGIKFPFKRGKSLKTYTLEPGDKFGLRKSTSTVATRMYLDKVGINHVFTLTGDMARRLLKKENSKPVGKQSVAEKTKSAAVEHVTSIRAALSKATNDPKAKSFFVLPEKSGAPWRLLARWMNLHEGVRVSGEMLYAYDRMRHMLNADNIGELKNPKPLTQAVVRGAAAIKKVLGRMPKEKELITVLRYIRSIQKGTRQPAAIPQLAWHDRKYVWDNNRYRRV